MLLYINVLELRRHVGILVVGNSDSLAIVIENWGYFCSWQGSKLVEKAAESNDFFGAYGEGCELCLSSR